MILRWFMSVASVWWKYYKMVHCCASQACWELEISHGGSIYIMDISKYYESLLAFLLVPPPPRAVVKHLPVYHCKQFLPIYLEWTQPSPWWPASGHPAISNPLPLCPMVMSLTSLTGLAGWNGTGYEHSGVQCLEAALSSRLMSWELRTNLL